MIVVVPADLYLVVCREGEVVLLEQHQLEGCSRVLYQGRQVVQVPVVHLSLRDQGLIQLIQLLRVGGEALFQKTRNDVRREKKQHQQQQHGSRRQDGPITGQATDTGLPSSALPNRSFFISRVHNSAGLQRMAQHIRNEGVDFVELTLTSQEHAVYNSFKLSVNVNDTANIKDPNFWQSGVFVRKWRD